MFQVIFSSFKWIFANDINRDIYGKSEEMKKYYKELESMGVKGNWENITLNDDNKNSDEDLMIIEEISETDAPNEKCPVSAKKVKLYIFI